MTALTPKSVFGSRIATPYLTSSPLGVTARMREFEKGVGGAFLADGGDAAMPGIHNRLIRQDQQLLMNRAQDSLERAAPKIGAADASGEKRVSGEELWGIAGGALFFCGAR